MKRIALIALSVSGLCGVANGGEATKKYRGAGDHWLHMDYPSSFTDDAKNSSGEEGWLWYDQFNDPGSDLSIGVSSYGYISNLDLLLTIPGVTSENYEDKLEWGTDSPRKTSMEELIAAEAKCKNAGEYFKTKMLKEGAEASDWPGYERYIQTAETHIVVYYLAKSAYQVTDGQLFQTLVFTFPEGELPKHRGVIDKVVQSARPAYMEPSEQGTGQPATDSESKSEGGDKPQPDAEGRSR